MSVQVLNANLLIPEEGDLNLNTTYGEIRIPRKYTKPAFEFINRFTVNPKWLIYLPPTMSPSETTKEEGYLEYPTESFEYFANRDVDRVICEQKHMGSRAVVIVCKTDTVPESRFKIKEKSLGVIYTRNGRRFFKDINIEQQLLERLNIALTMSDFWQKFKTDWVCLDCEIMPWSAKAQGLIMEQYAAVGMTALNSLETCINLTNDAIANQHIEYEKIEGENHPQVDLYSLYKDYNLRKDCIDKYIKSYQKYCWEIKSIEDYKIAPFFILATEGRTYFEMNHELHMKNIYNFVKEDIGILLATEYKIVDLKNEVSKKECIEWWLEYTSQGGEGMVIKPYIGLSMYNEQLVQPALKCRGKEYLRIIYGPEYDINDHLRRLYKRNTRGKRFLAIKEFMLGYESLYRFTYDFPLEEIHPYVFGVLALESEPMDPRL